MIGKVVLNRELFVQDVVYKFLFSRILRHTFFSYEDKDLESEGAIVISFVEG